jgi:MFS family permease
MTTRENGINHVQDKSFIKLEKKRHLTNIITSSLILIPFLAGFIGTYLLEFLSPETFDFFFILIILGRIFILFIIVPLAFVLSINSSKFHREREILKQERKILKKVSEQPDEDPTTEPTLDGIR